MKSILLTSAVAVALLAATGVQANPRSSVDAGGEYLFSAENLTGMHVGGFYRYAGRTAENDFRGKFTQDNLGFTVGFDVLRWATLYGIVGTTDANFEDSSRSDDYSLLYGGGLWINILDQDLITSLSSETKLRIQGMAQVTCASPEVYGENANFADWYANVTIEFINELVGNKNLWPDALGIFVGPAYSRLSCDDVKLEGKDFGLVFGLDIFMTSKVNLSVSYETYGSDNDAFGASLDIRF